MRQRGWTPGPWRLSANDSTLVITDSVSRFGNSRVIADVLNYVGQAEAQDEANARLISAAPDLYEALEVFDELASEWAVDARPDSDVLRVVLDAVDLKRARAARKKARGEA